MTAVNDGTAIAAPTPTNADGRDGGNPAVTDALTRQAQTLLVCPGIFHNDRRGGLMKKLIERAPAGLNKVFLCNSGTESVEAAIKFGRRTTGRAGLHGNW